MAKEATAKTEKPPVQKLQPKKPDQRVQRFEAPEGALMWADLPKEHEGKKIVDMGRHLVDTGGPKPHRIYEVQVRIKPGWDTGDYPPIQAVAVDESHAIAQYVKNCNIKESHAFRFLVTKISDG
jgi:hypothetical protein